MPGKTAMHIVGNAELAQYYPFLRKYQANRKKPEDSGKCWIVNEIKFKTI